MIRREIDSRAKSCARKRGVYVALFIAFAHFDTSPALTQAKSTTDFVANFFDNAWQCAPLSDPTGSDLVTRIARYVDIDHMAHIAFGSSWEQVGATERDQYLRAYRDLIRRVAEKYCFSRDVVFESLGSRRSGEIEIVAFRVQQPNERHDIYWYVQTVPHYSIVDIAIDGVLVTERQREEFAVIIRANNGDLTVLPAAIDRLQP